MNDAELISHHGGPAKVAELLKYDKAAGGVQRVQNWLTRGIPSKVKLDHPHLFLPPFGVVAPHDAAAPAPSENSPANAAPSAASPVLTGAAV